MMGYADPRGGTVSSDLRRNGLAHPCLCTTLSSFLVQTKIQGESKPEADPPGYVEDSCELRTKLGTFFSILLRCDRCEFQEVLAWQESVFSNEPIAGVG